MRQRRHAAAGRLLAALAALASALPLAAAGSSSNTDTIRVPANTCGGVGYQFNAYSFDYTASYGLVQAVPEGCYMQISKLYVSGTCSSQRNNNGNGCGGASGAVVSYSDPRASCAAVVSDAPSGTWTNMTVLMPSFKQFDSSSGVCADSTRGTFYVQNTCDQELAFTLQLNAYTYSSCYSSGFPSWARVTLGVACGLVILMLLLFTLRRCAARRASRPQQMAGVQMAPPPPGAYYSGAPPPPGAYGPDGTAGYPPPAGYPPAAGQASYAGAWGAGGAAPAGYPPAYGGQQPGQPPAGPPPQPHYPPPMTTVVLGVPEEAEGQPVGPPRPPAGGAAPGGAGSGASYGDMAAKV